MTYPIRTISMITPLMLRGDLTREAATTYWAEAHAEKVKKLPNIVEYNQRHFSPTDHSFWPSENGVGTIVPQEWKFDGLAELRFGKTALIPNTALHAREVYLDEQNVFGRVVGYPAFPNGRHWWTDGHDDTVGHRVTLMLRRRVGVRSKQFREFVSGGVVPALLSAGARDLRAYSFLPWIPVSHTSPGVAHNNPPHQRYHGAVIFGTDDRAAVDELLGSPSVKALVAEQHTVFTAVHAYGVERTVPAIRANTEA
ncbi:EthD domain-containing protein [Nocardia sp. NPDC057663]|uniref:EthD domain-containing protein n=1 Tax=Nocardia sp. NPDC057663 TaxID=3346201 RepID=UPI00366F8A7B